MQGDVNPDRFENEAVHPDEIKFSGPDLPSPKNYAKRPQIAAIMRG